MENKTNYVSEVEEVINSKTTGIKQQTGGDVLLVSEEGLRKIPIPTDDPNDPLNYSKWKKAGVVLTCCWFCKSALKEFSTTGDQTNRQIYDSHLLTPLAEWYRHIHANADTAVCARDRCAYSFQPQHIPDNGHGFR